MVVTAILFFFVNTLSYAQAPDDKTGAVEPDQPPDLHFQLTTKDGRTVFHLGEAIELEESYSADVADKYLLLSLPAKMNGHAAKVAIEPSQGVIDRHRDQGTRSAYSILHVNCLAGLAVELGAVVVIVTIVGRSNHLQFTFLSFSPTNFRSQRLGTILFRQKPPMSCCRSS